MKITRRFTQAGQDALSSTQYEKRTSRITNPDGSVVFEMNDAEIPKDWSQLATDIMVSKYFRKAGVPQTDGNGQILKDGAGNVVTGPEKSVKQVVNRLAGCWRHWGETHGYFDSTEDAQAFYDEISYMLIHQMVAPNSPQWFNTGLNWAYGITGPAQGHFYCDPASGELKKSSDAYTHPQPHACQPYHAPVSTPRGPIPIGKIVADQMIGMEVFDGTDGNAGPGEKVAGAGVTRIVAAIANGVKHVHRVILEGGIAIEATADHLVYVRDSQGLSGRWVRVDSLDKSMKLIRICSATTQVAAGQVAGQRKNASAEADRLAAGARSGGSRRAARANDRLAEAAAEMTEGSADAVAAAIECAAPLVRELSVVRVKSVGEREVFDIQTESGQYLSNGVVVHNCFIQSVTDDLVNAGGIMDLWTREARLFKYGSGTGTNFSRLRGNDEPLSGGGKSSGLMSFLKIGDRAAGAIKSGGTTRRAAKMVCLDLDHPDIEDFVNWKVREELKVAALAEGMKALPPAEKKLAEKLKLKLDYDFNGESYLTVSGQNSNNSVRIPNEFFKALEEDADWTLTWRTNGKTAKTIKARDLWEQIAFAAWRCADPGVQYDTTINQWHTCPRSGRINASNPCVTGDTRVLCPGGIWRRIDQMIHLPSRVVTNLKQQQIEATDGAFPTGVQEVYELKTQSGYGLKLTADHTVWTKSRGWVAAKDLLPIDQVRLPSKPATVQEIGEPQDPQFFQLLGLYLSAANASRGAVHLGDCLGDGAQADALARYVVEHWADRAYDDDYVNLAMLPHDEAGEIGTATAVDNPRLLSRLKAFVRIEAGATRLSDDAFTAGLAAQRHLLQGLFSADGMVVNGTIELLAESLGLLEDLQTLLLGFGVKCNVYSLAPELSSAMSAAVESPRHLASGNLSGHNEPTRIGGADALSEGLFAGKTSDIAELPDRQTNVSGQAREISGQRGAGSARRGNAVSRRHGLRIDSGSLRVFCTHVGLLPGEKLQRLLIAERNAIAVDENAGHFDPVATLTPMGRRQVFDLTEPATHSFIANGLTIHNCSEYMFLDDTACNLASLNVLRFFDAESRRFDHDGYRHGIRLWTIVLEISVLMASFPSEEIATLSYKFRTLGLGYANLGAMLMQAGIGYDSPRGRAICAALTAILTGESYATSAELAESLGAFPGYQENQADMLRVIRNHRRAAYHVAATPAARRALGDYEGLDIRPVGIDASQFSDADPLASRQMLKVAIGCWDRALHMGEQFGFRNAQTTVIAPTGTIGLLMDCDTTGVEPDFALVKFKKLAGGGYFKIANQSLRPALVNLGYDAEQVHDILRYVMGSLTLHDAPNVSYQRLLQRGFTTEELDKIETSLPGQFEISFAFSPWSLSPKTFDRLGIAEAIWQAPGFNLLSHLGFSKKQINEANDAICGRGTVEGSPHLKIEHYPVFDCANKCGKHGSRFIPAQGHIRMMAAAQPFISGAISKTINLPNEAKLDDIKEAYLLSWELGLKANALYRDGSKLSQPLNVKSDEELEDKTDAEDAEGVEAARAEVANEVVTAAQALFSPVSHNLKSDNLSPAHTHVVEKIVERIVERPLRRRLPDTRNATTHKFDVAGHEGYITVGLYDDGQPGEIFIRMAKEGSTIGGLMDTIATLVSVSLQYGVPVDSLVRKFEHVRFEPSGMTRNSEIPIAKSLVDYIFRWLAMEFVLGYRAANAPRREPPAEPVAEPAAEHKSGNGHGTRIEPDAKPFNYDDAPDAAAGEATAGASAGGVAAKPADAGKTAGGLRMSLMSDPVSRQGTEMQADAPACDVCGSITVRSGTCYKCLNCGNSMGCS